MRKLSILLPFAMLSSGYVLDAHSTEISPYIVNGTSVTDSEIFNTYPTFTSLYFHNGSSFGNYCGATLINSQYILTAAHCVHDDQGTPNYNGMLHSWAVPRMADEAQYNTGAYLSGRVEEVYFPSTYDENLNPSLGPVLPDDIAIMKLESAINVSDYQSRINSTVDNSYALNNGSDTFRAVGRGLIEGQASSNGKVLQTNLTIQSIATCGSSTTSKQLCFTGIQQGNYKNSTCNGDSGGPVYWWDGSEYKQVGITSYGPQTCGDPNQSYTSVFTEVYDYSAWISNVLNGTEDPKYIVQKSADSRQLIEKSTGFVKATSSALVNSTVMPAISTSSSTSSSSSNTGGGGGSLGYLSFLLISAALFRRKLTS
ncbi:S1 family peptidase [Vibrio coralliilyticus]|uniref:S1 family peptidase n=1 Tax=Vibrio coralliilyticus TaxID=190893 RepID=UPI0006CC31BD|nr:trypsin-like serine protease [Vibrio coralliilyticus]AXN33532.1 serine protease [Vibrio coralliilyticus]KPH23355.1 serine protease [Vibrio coralliilyticus]